MIALESTIENAKVPLKMGGFEPRPNFEHERGRFSPILLGWLLGLATSRGFRADLKIELEPDQLLITYIYIYIVTH